MGLLDGIIGNASESDVGAFRKRYSQILIPGEQIKQTFKIIRDFIVFTDKRLLLIDIQGITGSKTSYLSVPYKSITMFSVETAGTLDLDSELFIWVSSRPAPIIKKFANRQSVFNVQAVLALNVLGAIQAPVILDEDDGDDEDFKWSNARESDESNSDTATTTETAEISIAQATSIPMDCGEDRIDFCFHCGEPLSDSPAQCPSCKQWQV